MNCYDVATAGPGVRASCSPRSTTCTPQPRPARWSPSAAPPLRPRRSGRRSWRPATSLRASPLSLCRRLWVRAHTAGVAESAMYMLVHALVLLPSLSPCACLAVADRMNPITVDSFRDHVNMMHDERDKGFEAEYQVTHQLHSHSVSTLCVRDISSPLSHQSFGSEPLATHEIAKRPHNRPKNRFANIFPCEYMAAVSSVQCGLWPACHCAVFLSSLLRRCVLCTAGGDPGGGGIGLHQRLLDGRESLTSEPVPQCQCCLTHLCCALHCSQGYNRQKTYIAAQGEWE